MSKKIQINGTTWKENAIPNWYINDCDIVLSHYPSVVYTDVSVGGFSCKQALDGLKVNTIRFIPKTEGKISLYILPTLKSQSPTKVATIEVNATDVDKAVAKTFNTVTIPNGGWLMIGSKDTSEASDNTLSWYYSSASDGLGFYLNLGTAAPGMVNNQCIGFSIGYFPD